MPVIKSLLGNEHGLFAVLLLIASAIFVALGRMPVADWQSYSEWIFGLWSGTHVGVGVASALTGVATSPSVAPSADAAKPKE